MLDITCAFVNILKYYKLTQQARNTTFTKLTIRFYNPKMKCEPNKHWELEKEKLNELELYLKLVLLGKFCQIKWPLVKILN